MTEDNWQDYYWRDEHPIRARWLASETPHYVGRAVTALAADPDVINLTGQFLTAAGLAERYRFTDRDGTRPGHGIYSKGYLDGQRPRREDYLSDEAG